MRRQVLLLLFSLFAIVGFAQQRTVTGTVVSAEDGLPVIGASVHVKGTSQGATTDLDGKYSIKVNENASLTFSYVGMQPKTVQVGNQSVINVTLTSSSTQLDEVVVTAMGIREEKKKLKKEQQAQRKEEKTELRRPEPKCRRSYCWTIGKLRKFFTRENCRCASIREWRFTQFQFPNHHSCDFVHQLRTK